jgi:hypothetical protein
MHWTSFKTEDGPRYSVLLQDATEVDLVQAGGGWKLCYSRSADENWTVLDRATSTMKASCSLLLIHKLARLLGWPELAEETTLLHR